MRTSLSRFSGIPIPVAIALCVVCGGPWGDLPAQEAKDILFEPGSVVEGRAFGDWLLDYWKWRKETPDDKNPGFDDTLPCSAEQDSDVFFLPLPPALSQGSRDYARSCSVPAGKPVLLPLILALVPCELCCPFAPLDGVTELTCEIRRLSPAGNLMSSFEFGFDDLVAHRETRAECFELLPPGPPFRAATDGFVVMLKPLEAGRYTIDTLAIVDTPDGPAVAATQYDIEVEEERNGETLFLRGDCNDDGEVNISDATCALNRLFVGGPAPACLAALNTNGDDDVNIADPVFLLNFLFAGGPDLSAPYPDCGPGLLPADEELGCANPPNCQ